MSSVNKYSLGITMGTGKTLVVVPKDTPLPVQRSLTVSTTEDQQRNIGLIVTLGERPLGEDNFQLSRIRLDDIDTGPKGEPRVRLTFRGYTNGLWSVGVQCRPGAAEQELSIIPSVGLSKAEVDKMQAKVVRYVEEHKRDEEALAATDEIIPLPAI
ncbi:MAG: heat shock 70 family protein [Dehalococcoidia bacterium]|nr:heat shock 70 family protein [Dehalococcoidia bacterium]